MRPGIISLPSHPTGQGSTLAGLIGLRPGALPSLPKCYYRTYFSARKVVGAVNIGLARALVRAWLSTRAQGRAHPTPTPPATPIGDHTKLTITPLATYKKN